MTTVSYFYFAAGYFASVLAAVERPSRIVRGISGPGNTTDAPGPGFVPLLSMVPQSCAAWRTNGSGFAQPLILEAMVRMRSVAEAPTPPQSSQAERYFGGRAALPSCADVANCALLFTFPLNKGCSPRSKTLSPVKARLATSARMLEDFIGHKQKKH